MGTSAGQSVATSVMMQLSSFQFSIATAAYQDLTRRSEWRWPSQDRFGQLPALQYTGPNSESITLAGVIYPEYVGSVYMLAKMRALAGRGVPLPLIDGNGNTLGRWVIENVEEKQSTFAAAGAPRRQDFTLQLKLFDRRQAEQTGIIAAVGAATSGASASSSPLSGLSAIASDMTGGLTGSITSMAATLSDLKDRAQAIGDAVSPVVSGVQGAMSTAMSLKEAAANLKASLKGVDSLSDAQSAMYSVLSAASAVSNAGSLASSAAEILGGSLVSSGSSAGNISAVKTAQAITGSLAAKAVSYSKSIAKIGSGLFS